MNIQYFSTEFTKSLTNRMILNLYRLFRTNYIFLILLCLILLFQNCSTKSCQSLPNTFSSYQDAKQEVRNSSGYNIKQKRSLKSSWLKSAEYYSCDGKNGFLIITTNKGKTFIHSLVPEKIWSNFINSHSYGNYYVKNIKSNYQLSLD